MKQENNGITEDTILSYARFCNSCTTALACIVVDGFWIGDMWWNLSRTEISRGIADLL